MDSSLLADGQRNNIRSFDNLQHIETAEKIGRIADDWQEKTHKYGAFATR